MALMTANQSYRTNQITTAGPGQLVVMAYDGMLRFLREADVAMRQKNYEAQNRHIQKTQALLMELLCTLNHSASPELARNLDALYRWMYDRLTQANIHDELQTLAEVTGHLAKLRDAWSLAAQKVRGEEHMLAGGRQL